MVFIKQHNFPVVEKVFAVATAQNCGTKQHCIPLVLSESGSHFSTAVTHECTILAEF